MTGPLDQTTAAQAFSGPGMDTRTWVSYAVVDVPTDGQGDSQTVEFSNEDDDGQVYVNVTLKPSDTPLRARLGMLTAGSGEAVYFPFVGGEEVLVVIPEGHMRAGAVIVARLNNAYDPFPFESVGGADPTKNSFGLIRTRNALTLESGNSVLLRAAAAGAMLQLSAAGACTMRDGGANVLQLSPDVFGYQNAGGDVAMQIDLNASRYTLAVGQVMVTLSGNGAGANPQSLLQVPASLALGTGGLSITTAAEHVATAEAVMNILSQLFAGIGVVNPGPLTGAALAAAYLAAAPPAIAAASTSPQLPTIGAALAAGFANPTMLATKALPASVAPGYQTFPGLGCPALLAG